MAFLLVIALSLGIVAIVMGGVWFVGREYDRHPLVRKFLDAEARLYVPPNNPDLPKSYTDQVPGWDDKP